MISDGYHQDVAGASVDCVVHLSRTRTKHRFDQLRWPPPLEVLWSASQAVSCHVESNCPKAECGISNNVKDQYYHNKNRIDFKIHPVPEQQNAQTSQVSIPVRASWSARFSRRGNVSIGNNLGNWWWRYWSNPQKLRPEKPHYFARPASAKPTPAKRKKEKRGKTWRTKEGIRRVISRIIPMLLNRKSAAVFVFGWGG